ncbi:hypothetical protein P7M41_25725, partial [Vibrio parahaemolyticus]|nr:hypothetical protein [Vibrio parahaemolyticus]
SPHCDDERTFDTNINLANVRSLLNKTFIINDLILDNSIDFMFLTETWLNENNSAAVLIESAPPNFHFISSVRELRKGGGVATLFKDVYQCKQLSYGKFESFEYVALQLRSSCQAVLVTIYRPPKYSAHFVDDFS